MICDLRFALLWFPLTEAQRRRDFLGAGLAASRGSRVNLSYCDHAVARNLESKSAARLFHAKARRREGCEVELDCGLPR